MRYLLTETTVILLALASSQPIASQDNPAEPVPNRPKVTGKLHLNIQERKEKAPGRFDVVKKTVDWEVSETAIIICDMWDDHYCKSAAQRVGVMAPSMNKVITAARNHGVM